MKPRLHAQRRLFTIYSQGHGYMPSRNGRSEESSAATSIDAFIRNSPGRLAVIELRSGVDRYRLVRISDMEDGMKFTASAEAVLSRDQYRQVVKTHEIPAGLEWYFPEVAYTRDACSRIGLLPEGSRPPKRAVTPSE